MAAVTPQQGRHPRTLRSTSHVHPLQWQLRRHLQSKSMICGYCLYAYRALCVCVCVCVCVCATFEIELVLASSVIPRPKIEINFAFCLPLFLSAYFSHLFSKMPLRASPSAAGLLTLCTFLSHSFFVALTCVVIAPREYSALTGPVEAGCHSADQMGPQFTMSIGSQVSARQFHS